MGFTRCIFPKDSQLCTDLDAAPTLQKHASLPGQPRIALEDTVSLTEYLEHEFCAPDLERLAPHLWMMSTQSSSNISPLHRQKVKGRQLVVTEEPRLHLVWFYDRIFIKPVPAFLMSHAFWTMYLLSDRSPLGERRSRIRKAALGFIRTFHFLIRHESDFRIAQSEDLQVIPPSITYAQYCTFASRFGDIEDSEVSARWSYGELRLSRLNVYCKIFLRQYHFEQVHEQYGTFFSRFYGPLLFVFGIISLLLSGMQVELAVEQVSEKPWVAFSRICRWSSIVGILGILAVAVILMAMLVGRIVDEWVFAIKARRRKNRDRLER